MTSTASDAHSDAAKCVPRADVRRARVDLIGLGAVFIAGLGLAATMVVTRTAAPETTTLSATLAPTPPARDQWYADLAVATAVPVSSITRDRWYPDGQNASDLAKDRWYADPRRSAP